MGWHATRDDGRVCEWERSDGTATVRLRRRADGSWAVRLDVLYQAADGPAYRFEGVEDRAAGRRLVEEWQAAHDVDDDSGGSASSEPH
jgi:hypothetical protein